MNENAKPLIEVNGLRKYFGAGPHPVRAVDGVSFSIAEGETLGLVGESGSGKSTIGRMLIRLLDPTDGDIRFEDRDIARISQHQMRPLRSRMQIIFQDPYASLNPRMRIRQILGEALDTHGLAKGKARQPRIAELLELVGLRAEFADRYPHEFSGGQRQRIGVARALAVEPSFIVADEPLSALDVSIQAQVVNLLCDLKERFGLTMLFISHDLDVVEFLCDRVIVLYLGKIMEVAPTHLLYNRPRHPYTQALLAASPVPDPAQHADAPPLTGDIPSPANPPSGCVFRTRCPHARPFCAEQVPSLVEAAPGHWKACLRDDLPGYIE
jgi:peptide/nickel transport system ATP-binding protein